MIIEAIDGYIWVAGFIGHVALLWVFLIKRQWSHYPVFGFGIAYYAVQTAVLFLVWHFLSNAYETTYWITTCGEFFVQLAVIGEIVHKVFRPRRRWVMNAEPAIIAAVLTAVSIAVALTLSVSPPNAAGRDLWEFRGTLFSSLLLCELFVFISAIANRHGLQRRDHTLAIWRGLAFHGVCSVARDVVSAKVGWYYNPLFGDRLREFVYLIVLMYWIIALWKPERRDHHVSHNVDQFRTSLIGRR